MKASGTINSGIALRHGHALSELINLKENHVNLPEQTIKVWEKEQGKVIRFQHHSFLLSKVIVP